ncbi:DUF2231 domain-containing protein [Ferribacterium limneticum]|uniref:DUF2231 domain-containing protein n=1 Tax=Ferribacterium limneticum TaxID=76259 RepID=UPI001CF8A984|nr:DUF2231 domain-containing protein [Ferribacterium limneticum]UCV21638.1 DUF2231 domain-containing protein [Ferribacterium limneticum]
MPEIIPNWHPAVVHFPIALAVTATLLLLLGRLRPANPTFTASGRLLVLGAAVSAGFAAALGWYAFQTVEHDGAGHLVMLSHRNWALAGTAGLIALAVWDGLRQRAERPPHAALLPIMLVLSAGLGVTGWLGGEMVYRHGIGVSASAFAGPEVAAPTMAEPPAVTPETVAETPAPAPGEHIHKDGKRHRH